MTFVILFIFFREIHINFVVIAANYTFALLSGELAQLARALAWHARGHRFDSGILHQKIEDLHIICKSFFVSGYTSVRLTIFYKFITQGKSG